MSSMFEAVDSVESELFVGRERELAVFERWLAADTARPQLLNVVGRGGIGKSALLRAVARAATRLGKVTIFADSRDFPPTPDGLLRAFGGDSEGDVLARLNETRPLILIDTFEEMGEVTRYLRDQLLGRLRETVKVAIAGRYPLGRIWNSSPWRAIVHPLEIGVLSPSESREYLRRRGLSESGLVEQIARATGGNPLALTLATDVPMHVGARNFTATPEWHMVVRALVRCLLSDVGDPQLRELLEACSVVRQFDEATLAAISGQEDIAAAFDRLCQLSVVRPADDGLMLHDDLRRAMAEDLRWRNAGRYDALRLRALAYYRSRVQAASPRERERLLVERVYLCQNAFNQAMMFTEYEPGQVWVEPCVFEDNDAVLSFWQEEAAAVHAKVLGFGSLADVPAQARERDLNLLRAVARYPDRRLHVIRDPDGRPAGFSMAVPLCQESLGLFDLHPWLGAVLHSYYTPRQLAALPATAHETDAFYLLLIAHGQRLPEAVRAALMRDLFGLLAHGGVYFASVPESVSDPNYKALLEALGFQRVPAARNSLWLSDHPLDGYVLDLSRLGVERWIEALVSARQFNSAPDPAALGRQLRAALLVWKDDAVLSRSPLTELIVASAGGAEAQRAAAIRTMVLGALARAREGATPSEAAALNALDQAYLQKSLSHNHAARRLAVSRSTYFRLLQQGIRRLAQTISQV